MFSKVLTGCIVLILFVIAFSAPSNGKTLISSEPNESYTDFSCSKSELYSLRQYTVTCFLPDLANASSVIVSFKDGLKSSPVPSKNYFTKTFSVPVTKSSQYANSYVFSFALSLWKSSEVYFKVLNNSNSVVGSFSNFFSVNANEKPVAYKKGSELKDKHFVNSDPRPLGNGANVMVTSVPSNVKKFMSGVSHQPSCISFKDLRLISFNYFSIDGFTHRGFLVSNKDVAPKVAKIVSKFFDWKFRLHSAHLPDIYGVAPSGKGANDYKSMASGNTSMFNCRFVVGRESSKILSPHASGRSIDINTWENPYASRTGVYPNRFWFDNRLSHDLVFTSNHKVVKLLKSYGFTWGGSYRDYHHFQF